MASPTAHCTRCNSAPSTLSCCAVAAAPPASVRAKGKCSARLLLFLGLLLPVRPGTPDWRSCEQWQKSACTQRLSTERFNTELGTQGPVGSGSKADAHNQQLSNTEL
eukprot:1159277-Pelagomonas_calceolata.AAC.8